MQLYNRNLDAEFAVMKAEYDILNSGSEEKVPKNTGDSEYIY